MDPSMQLQVVFFKALSGSEPVREWLKSLSVDDKKIIGRYLVHVGANMSLDRFHQIE